MASNALATLPSLNEIGSTALSTEILSELTKAGDYLERIQLYQGSSGACKENKIQPGKYGVPKSDAVDELGDAIDLLVIAAKPKALETYQNGDQPLAVHDSASAEFQRIKDRAENEDDSGCMYGIEFLVFERSTGKFYTYFASSASARREAGKMIPREGILPVTLSAKFCKKGRNSWHAPVVTKCSTPFTNVPAVDKIKAQVEKFTRPDSNDGREEVKTDEKQSRRAR